MLKGQISVSAGNVQEIVTLSRWFGRRIKSMGCFFGIEPVTSHGCTTREVKVKGVKKGLVTEDRMTVSTQWPPHDGTVTRRSNGLDRSRRVQKKLRRGVHALEPRCQDSEGDAGLCTSFGYM